jgi:hypothetical protein
VANRTGGEHLLGGKRSVSSVPPDNRSYNLKQRPNPMMESELVKIGPYTKEVTRIVMKKNFLTILIFYLFWFNELTNTQEKFPEGWRVPTKEESQDEIGD